MKEVRMDEPKPPFDLAVDYVRTLEKLLGVLSALRFASERLTELLDFDVTLGPEASAALDHLLAAGDAVGRCAVFAEGRFTVQMQTLSDEGGTQ